MSNTYFSSLSGMLAASYGLQNTSNNVANMQSHGFKRNELFYSTLGNGKGEEGIGRGVRISKSATDFSKGKSLQTNSPTDLAIVGNGFFVLRLKSNELVYTRDGEFEFQNEVLVDKHSGAQVQGYDHAGNLVSIYEKGPKTNAGKPSRDVFLNGSFIASEETKTDNMNASVKTGNYNDVHFDIMNIYDEKGKAHQIKLEFANKSYVDPDLPKPPQSNDSDKFSKINSWVLKDVRCEDMEISFAPDQEIVFSYTNSGAVEHFSTIRFTLDGKQPVNIYFGVSTEGKDSCVLLQTLEFNPGAKTDIQINKNDGYSEGKQYGFSFSDKGQIRYHYDNNQSVDGIHIALARFNDRENNLIQTRDNFFRAKTKNGIHFGIDEINPGSLEGSNVDSTTEFANIVILQRMFQACSQIMDIDKQLLQELEGKS
jgi:flagellar hook protein FlgE